MPRVSVVIPTYNRAAILPRALRSVLEQTYRDFEVIVADDASTDDTQKVVEAMGDARVRYVRRATRGGGSGARNTGIEHAQAELVAFQDSDDIWAPNKLERQMEVWETGPADLGVVYCGMRRTRHDRTRLVPEDGVYPEGMVFEQVLERNFVGTPTSVVRTAALHQVGGFDARLPRLQDWDLWIRISRNWRFAPVREILLEAPASDAGGEGVARSITDDASSLVRACAILHEKYAADFRRYPKAHKHHLQIAVNAALELDDRRRAFGYAQRNLRIDPERRDLLILVRSILGRRAYHRARQLARIEL